jgi:hypothetical protein
MPLAPTLNEYKVYAPVTGKAFYVTAESKEQAEKILIHRLTLLAVDLYRKVA